MSALLSVICTKESRECMEKYVIGEDQIKELFSKTGAILSGHFVLSSGRHSDTYVQCARVFEDPETTMQLASALAERISPKKVDLVAAPAVGGIILGFAVAHILGVRFIFSEREAGVMTFRRSFQVPEEARVLVVEDVVTTGGSAAEVETLIRACGGSPIGVASLIDRGGSKRFMAESYSLLQLDVESWEADSCSLCGAGEPITSPGSRRIAD